MLRHILLIVTFCTWMPQKTHAHTGMESETTVEFGKDRITLVTRVSPELAWRLLGPSAPTGALEASFEKATPALTELARGLYTITADSSPLKPTSARVLLELDRHVAFVVKYPHPGTKALSFQATFLAASDQLDPVDLQFFDNSKTAFHRSGTPIATREVQSAREPIECSLSENGTWLIHSQAAPGHAPDAVVALDGSGDFKSIEAAIMAAPYQDKGESWTIAIKPGTYKERVYVQLERGRIRLLGEDPLTTKLTYDVHASQIGTNGKPLGTFQTPTLQIDGDDFEIENLSIENAAGPVGQALALRVDGDRATFRNCRFLGWQDTILLNRGRQYFENCHIEGHVDFIFGAATAWFEKCNIHCLKDGFITAASTPANQAFGFIFNQCKITGEPKVKTYLGRPWRPFAMTAFVKCEFSDVVRPEGWNNWNKPESEKDFRYIECANTGPGAETGQRASFVKLLAPGKVSNFTSTTVLAGDDGWAPQSKPRK